MVGSTLMTEVNRGAARREFGEPEGDSQQPRPRTSLNLIFCDPQGNYLKPDFVAAKAFLIARKPGMVRVSLHTLRYGNGSQLLISRQQRNVSFRQGCMIPIRKPR